MHNQQQQQPEEGYISNNDLVKVPLHLIGEGTTFMSTSTSTSTNSTNSKSIKTQERRNAGMNQEQQQRTMLKSSSSWSWSWSWSFSRMVLFNLSFLHCFQTVSSIAFHNGASLSPSTASFSSVSTPASSSNALALLNTVRQLRVHKVSKQKSSSSSSQEDKFQLDLSLSLPNEDGTMKEAKRLILKQQNEISMSLNKPNAYHKALFDDDESKEEDFISHRVEKQLPSVKSLLHTSKGNDVPNMELQLQMEAAMNRARGKECSSVAALAFMDLHHHTKNGSDGGKAEQGQEIQSDVDVSATNDSVVGRHRNAVSAIEKVAMTSLPSQLPGLAVHILNGNTVNSSPPASRSRRSTNSNSVTRITKVKKVSSSLDDTTTSRTTKPSNVIQKGTLRPKAKASVTNSNRKKRSIKKQKKSSSSSKASSSTINKIQTKQISNIMTAKKTLAESPSPTYTVRVSHDEEIQLARIIQRGAELHNIKSKFEKKHTRDITRQEWAELAKLDSPKDLRRLVSDYRKAKNKLVMANMGLVHAIVKTRMREFGGGMVSYEGISYEDMVQEGSLGLLRAAELFDPSRGLRFSTYATIWIKGILGNNNLSEAITLPLREKNKFKKIQKAIEDISAEKAVDNDGVGYKPTEKEIGKHCGLKADDVGTVMTKMKRAKNVLSLDYQYDSTSRSGIQSGKFDALSNDKNLMDDVDLVEKLQLRADIVAALTRNLDPREARLMRLRYGLNDGKTRSIQGCAEAMGISKARAQQLAAGCLKKLREADDAESLQEYLLSVA